ncbi:hypothetical protein PV04_10104 [Phialophora macrospora]|uniref:Uncharacterized protein n=1 Tax=Phialophora macrospora TaxID=1851006 RepID=A0A0D2CDR9_9EURO|nr:hypothetical protein PV04_10104 [Phialophora macrospora]
MDEAEKEEFRVFSRNWCRHARQYTHTFWSREKVSRFMQWEMDVFNAINAVNFDDREGESKPFIRPTSISSFLDVLDNVDKCKPPRLRPFTIGKNTFYALPQHYQNDMIHYFYQPEEYTRHPSWPKPEVPYVEEAGTLPFSSCAMLNEMPIMIGYWQHMEIFRPGLDASTSYLAGSRPRRLKKPLALEFGCFLGSLWYDSSQTDRYDRAQLRPTPFVVLIHPIDKSFWVVFNHFPLAKRKVTMTEQEQGDLVVCDECRGDLNRETCRFNGYNVPVYNYYEDGPRHLIHPKISYVAPIERLEDVDFWKELDMTPFSVLRIPAFRDGGRRNTAEDMADDDDMTEAGEEKEEDQSGPFFEVGLGSVTMRVEAINVRPNPFKAKHKEWERYWKKWIFDPSPGDPPSPTHEEDQDEPAVAKRSRPKCRLCNKA